ALLASTALVGPVTLALPYTPAGRALGFQPLKPWFLITMVVIVALYIASAELAKMAFYRRGRRLRRAQSTQGPA
ncbi:hypothetical protein ACYOEI_06425, partial [Singulisphaera rosea]